MGEPKIIREQKHFSTLIVATLGKILLKNKLFFYEDIFLFPLIQWYIWVYFNTDLSVKGTKGKNYATLTLNLKKIPQIVIELLIGMFRLHSKEIECLAISPRSALSGENTLRGFRHLQPLTDYTFEELQRHTEMLSLDGGDLGERVLNPIFLYRHLKRDVKSVPYRFYTTFCRLSRKGMIDRKVAEFSASFEKDWKKLVGNSEFQEEVQSIKKVKSGFSINNFKSILRLYFIQKIKQLIYADYALDKIAPKYLFVLNEYGNMPLIYMAKKKGLKTYALQHGVIHINHPGYIYPKELKGYVSLCDIHFVFGRYEKRLLTECSIFDQNQVKIVGNPRMINLYHGDVVYKSQMIRRHLGVSKGKKILLYASSWNYGPSTKELFNINKRLFEDFAPLESEYTLVIKLHPAETDFSKYHDAANKYGVKNYVVVRDYDLYALLYISDVVLGVISTVMSEAVAFKKNIIVYSNNVVGDQIDYVEWGVAVRREDFNSLKDMMDCFDSDNDFGREIEPKRKDFVDQFFYKIDDRPVQRILETIKSQKEDKLC